MNPIPSATTRSPSARGARESYFQQVKSCTGASFYVLYPLSGRPASSPSRGESRPRSSVLWFFAAARLRWDYGVAAASRRRCASASSQGENDAVEASRRWRGRERHAIEAIFRLDGDRAAPTRSEAAQNLSKKHPAHSLIKTSRVDGVKAPRDAASAPSRCCCWFFVICSSRSSVSFCVRWYKVS